jgi:hypothetical protein
MAFTDTATIKGSKYTWKLSPSVKRFTLRDNGFEETNGRNYQLIRPIEATPQSDEGFRLKITVNKDLKTFKMSITTADGLRKVDIFKSDATAANQEKFYFLMAGMVDRGVFEQIEN